MKSISAWILSMMFLCTSITTWSQQVRYMDMPVQTGEMDEVSLEHAFNAPGCTEITQERTQNSRVFSFEDGRIIYQYSKAPLNYLKNGQWEEISGKPVATENGWEANQQPNPVHLNSTGELHFFAGDKPVFGLKTVSFFGESYTAQDPVPAGNSIYIPFSPQIGQVTTFRKNGVKNDFDLHYWNAGQNATIEQELYCDASYTLKPHPQLPEVLSLLAASGEEMGRIYPVLCVDANGISKPAPYTWKKTATGYRLRIELNTSWLSAGERSFPVTIDPLITGPTALWGGGYMPSCFLPTYNVDSMLVTIPGQITITGVYITSSYYANPWNFATMSQGEMYFSTSCDQTNTLTVAPPTGNSAGTAYLEDFDYRNPLTCCLGASCQPRDIYVRMHLGRSAGGVGCDLNYIYYDPLSQWPFSVYVEGRTLQTNGIQWSVTPTTLCSDECDVEIQAYAQYGVAPYTITHPWTSDSTVFGNNVTTCSFATQTSTLNLTRPNCPLYCDTSGQVVVPIPTIRDVCGNTVANLSPKNITIKPTPQVSVQPASILICSGENAQINFTACPSGTPVNWGGGGTSGTGSIDTTVIYTGSDTLQIPYIGYTSLNGCASDSVAAHIQVLPHPLANFNLPDLEFINIPVPIADSSDYLSGSPQSWSWTFGDGSSSTDSVTSHVYPTPGTYVVCLTIVTPNGCSDTICDSIEIIPATIVPPNIITPNQDGLNETLYFEYLEYFGKCRLQVYNRWGFVVYESPAYANDWNGGNLVDGTYFYILDLENGEQYTNTLNIVKNP